MKNKSTLRKQKRTAIVVIHGIGEQVPFETLDAFAANFTKCFGDVKLSHKIVTRKNGADLRGRKAS